MAKIEVDSPNVTYGDRYIEADYDYCTTRVESSPDGRYKVKMDRHFIHTELCLSMRTIVTNRSLQMPPDCVSGRNVKFPNSALCWSDGAAIMEQQ